MKSGESVSNSKWPTRMWSLDDVPAYRSLVEKPGVWFVDSVLRGVGQVMFQNNAITGILFLVGIFYNSWIFGLYAILGTVVSTLAAVILRVPRRLVRNGLFGFNGTLLGIAFAFFLEPSGVHVLYTIAGAVCVTVVMAALLNFLGTWDVSPLTGPFVVTTWLFIFAFYHFGTLQATEFLGPVGLPTAVTSVNSVTGATYYEGFFKGVGQVFFQNNVVTGIIFLVAILVNSRISCLFAALGSIVALLVALGFGASEAAVHSGLYGFSAVLTGIAVGGFFLVIDWRVTLYTLVAVVITAIAFGTISVALAPIGMPALTAPFVVVTWFFVFGKRFFPGLQVVPLAEITSAEGNLLRFKARQVQTETEEAA